MENRNTAVYPLQEGRFINRFLETPLLETRECFPSATMGGRINEWIKKGVHIVVSPGRMAYMARQRAKAPEYVDMSKCFAGGTVRHNGRDLPVALHLPYGNVSVDHSAFWHLPTSMVCYHVTWLESPCEQDMDFELATPGGATVWLEETVAVRFQPFERNRKCVTEFQIHLQKGLNRITVCLEQMGERDTNMYFRLKPACPEGMRIHLPIMAGVDAKRLQAAENVLHNACVHLDRELEGKAEIGFVNATGEDVEIAASLEIGENGNAAMENSAALQRFMLAPGEGRISLKPDTVVAPQFCTVKLQADVDGMRLTRKLGVPITCRTFTQMPPKTMAERKADLLDFAAHHGTRDAYRAVALLEKNENLALANSILRAEIPGIRQRKDCSDFWLIAHIYALRNHRDKLDKDVIISIEDALFTFRYWFDEPGNDAMWYYSENHALLFHACQYIAGQMYPEQLFMASGLTGRQCEAKALGLLESWFDIFETEFMSEWNSASYLPIDGTGFGFLLLMTDPHSELHRRIRKALDRIFLCVAQHALGNIYAASYGRIYEKQLKSGYVNGPATLMYLGYGVGCYTSHNGPVVPLCLSDYEPPAEYARYLRPEADEYLWNMNNQGYEKFVNLTLYKTDRVLLSTANNFKPYQPGFQEHIVQASIDATACCFVSHPAETHPFGTGRPNYWHGNDVLPLAMQWKDLAVIRYRNPETALVPFTHAYFPFEAFDRVIYGEDWYCGQKGGGYIYVWAKNGLRRQMQGAYRLEELISDGLENCWMIRVGDTGDYATLEDFAAASQCSLLEDGGAGLRLSVGSLGEVTLEEQPAALKINGRAMEYCFAEGRGELSIIKREER